MLRLIFSILILLFHHSANSQLNLVGDPSFEDTSSTVNGDGQQSLKQWRNLDSTKPTAVHPWLVSSLTKLFSIQSNFNTVMILF